VLAQVDFGAAPITLGWGRRGPGGLSAGRGHAAGRERQPM